MSNRHHREKTSPHLRRQLGLVVALFLFLLPLAACGKKPNQVDPPPTVEEDTFPRIYPDPATDPKP
jgi:hypothetical protein